MPILLFYPCLLLVLLLGANVSVQAQKAFTIQLQIDTIGLDTSTIRGTFGLHANVRDLPYSSAFKDTLLEELRIVALQNIAIPAATRHCYGFHLVFTPEDTLLDPRQCLFQGNPYQKATLIIDLNS